jgi:hypothetical protein
MLKDRLKLIARSEDDLVDSDKFLSNNEVTMNLMLTINVNS